MRRRRSRRSPSRRRPANSVEHAALRGAAAVDALSDATHDVHVAGIASGVLGGLLVGALVCEAYEPHAIRSLSVVGTLALGAQPPCPSSATR